MCIDITFSTCWYIMNNRHTIETFLLWIDNFLTNINNFILCLENNSKYNNWFMFQRLLL